MTNPTPPEPAPESGEVLISVGRELSKRIRGKVAFDQPVAELVSFRVGGPAAIVVEPEDADDLGRVGEVLAAYDLTPLVVGRGTNLLVSDRGFPGVIVRLGKQFDWISGEGLSIEAGGATPLPQVANRAARLGLTGLEFAIAIPAAVGGAIRMNAGAHGRQMSDVVVSAWVCDLRTGRLEELLPLDLAMSYRQTGIGSAQVVTSARFGLRQGDPAEIASAMKQYRLHRTETQPAEAPNAGSMFRNPPNATAGALIESAGLKGYREDAAEVSRKHANFFLANPGATAQSIFDLMAHVQATVLSKSGVLLVPEVTIVGKFSNSGRLRIEP